MFPTPSLEDPLNRSKSGLNDSLSSPSRFLQSIRKDGKELIERKLKIKLEGLISCAPWAVLDCLSYSAIRAEQISFIDTDLIDFSLRSKHSRGLLSSQLQDSRLLGVSFPDVRQIRLVSCYSLSEHVVEGILLVFPGIQSLEIFSSTEKELDYGLFPLNCLLLLLSSPTLLSFFSLTKCNTRVQAAILSLNLV